MDPDFAFCLFTLFFFFPLSLLLFSVPLFSHLFFHTHFPVFLSFHFFLFHSLLLTLLFFSSVLVNNAAHIAWLSFFSLNISAPGFDSRDCPGHWPVDWSVSSQASGCEVVCFSTAENPFIPFLCCTISDQTYCRTCQSYSGVYKVSVLHKEGMALATSV